jgi:uncharacterized membrane protein
MLDTFLPGVQHLQNIHPLVVHFPIAFLMGAALLYCLTWVLNNDSLATTAFSVLVIGAFAALVAVATGLYAESSVMISHSVREHLLEPHEKIMLSAMGLSVFLTIWALGARPFPQKGRWIFLLLMFILVAVISLGADYGARMVYDYNAGGNACSQPIEFSK